MVIGGGMEVFMIQTGFYEKCVRPLPGFRSAPNHTLTLTPYIAELLQLKPTAFKISRNCQI